MPPLEDLARGVDRLRAALYRLAVLLPRAFSGLTELALLASRVVCLIVVAWFVVFAVGQSSSATTHQVNELVGAHRQQTPSRPAKEGAAKKTLNEAAKAILTPFANLTSGTSSAWLSHGADTLLALLVYGFGVGFLVRLVRLRF